jgi:hypothetical protein
MPLEVTLDYTERNWHADVTTSILSYISWDNARKDQETQNTFSVYKRPNIR